MGESPQPPSVFLSISIAINRKWILPLSISSYRRYFQGASSWPSWWSSLSFPSSYIASALQHLTSTIWSTGLPKTHHSLPSLCETISNRDTDVLLLLLHRILNTIFNLSPEPWALQSITMTLKTSPQRNQMSMKGCERKPFGRQVILREPVKKVLADFVR